MTDTKTDDSNLPTATWDALRAVAIAAKGSNQIAGIMSQGEWARFARAIAAPLIAVELRRMADAVGPQAGVVDGSDAMTRRACAADLRKRAAEIDRATTDH